jgi:hypothetical protein
MGYLLKNKVRLIEKDGVLNTAKLELGVPLIKCGAMPNFRQQKCS